MRVPKLSVVVPALNEEKYIAETLIRLSDWLVQNGLDTDSEVIVVAAKGNDKTSSIADKHGERFYDFNLIEPGPKVGKGRDVQVGMLAAKGDVRIFTDADLATPLHHILPAMDKLHNGADVVIGVRNLRKLHKSIIRKYSSLLSNLIICKMLHLSISDTQCGFKGFTADAANFLFRDLTTMGWGFDFEILAKSTGRDYKIEELQILDWNDPKGVDGLAGESQLDAMIKTLGELRRLAKNRKKNIN
ncbi:glycosyltransferase [bacterium]|nr:glycosyltransferase [bacterium]